MGSNKKRKTRRQKVLADLHRKLNAVKITPSVQKEDNIPIPEKVIASKPQTALDQYPYLISDITRTAVVTASIVASQIILFIILKFHVIKLPGISY